MDHNPTTEAAPNESTTRRSDFHRSRKLTLETSLEQNIHKCNPQQDSPLWGLLPQEIRDIIFQLATAQFEDMSRAYEVYDKWYRPDHRGPLVSYTSILQTCRRAWLEANALPMQQAVHTFWCFKKSFEERHVMTPVARWSHFKTRLTPLNFENFHSIHLMIPLYNMHHIFGQQYSVYDFIERLKPKNLKVTNSYHDWPSSDWRHLDVRTAMFERQTRNSISQLLRACSDHVENFQLDLEVLEGEWREQLLFFKSIRATRVLGTSWRTTTGTVPEGLPFTLAADGPRVLKWRQQTRPGYHATTELSLRVLTLDWVRTSGVSKTSTISRSDISDHGANSVHVPLQTANVDQSHYMRRDTDGPEVLRSQQAHVERQAQALSEILETERRRRFTEQLIETEAGMSLSRMIPEDSLLRVMY